MMVYKYIKYLKFALLFLVSFQLYSQEINKEYLTNKINTWRELPSIEQQKDSLAELSLQLIRQTNDLTISQFNIIDSLVSNNELKLIYYFHYAATASRNGDVVLSKELRKQGLKMAQEQGNTYHKFEFLNSLASLYVSLNKADSVAYYNILADKLLKKHPEELNFGRWQIDYRYAMMHELLGNSTKQKTSLEKSWNTIKDDENNENRGFLLYILLDFYRGTNDDLNQAKFTELFIKHYNKKKLNTPDYHFPIETILLKDDSKKSLNNLKRINKLSDSLNNLNSLSQTTTTLASRLIEVGRAEEAIPYLENSMAKLKAANYPISNSGELALLQSAYRETGNYKKAYTILKMQKAMEDSLRSSEMLKTIADYEVKYETEKKDNELQKLNFEAENLAQQKIIYLIALVSGALILATLAFFYYRNRKQNSILAKQKKMLEVTVDEKNVLLKETHHRVKNSFQIVSSLLYLQSETIKDKEAQAAMKEAQNRVRSMVLIHQRLYSKEQLVGVSTDEYIKDLVKDVFESHQAETEKIFYTIEADPMILGIETTTSLGLIINELITNVIKHAYPNKTKKGTMHVTFKEENKTLVLNIIDDGQGMKDEIKDTSFGIELITALAHKLKAELTFTPNVPKGTVATLIIKKFIAL